MDFGVEIWLLEAPLTTWRETEGHKRERAMERVHPPFKVDLKELLGRDKEPDNVTPRLSPMHHRDT